MDNVMAAMFGFLAGAFTAGLLMWMPAMRYYRRRWKLEAHAAVDALDE